MFTAMERTGLIVVQVNTSSLQVGDYELNITVNGTFLQCASSASQVVTTSGTEPTLSYSATTSGTEPTLSYSATTSGTEPTLSYSATTSGTEPTLSYSATASGGQVTLPFTSSQSEMSSTSTRAAMTSSTSLSFGITPSSDAGTTPSTIGTSDGMSVSVMDATSSISSASAVGPSSTPSPSPSPSPQPMSFVASVRLVVRVVPPTVLSVDNAAPFPTDTVTFNCSYWNSSATDISYVWAVGGMTVENATQSLYSLNITFEDNGTTVHCIANGEMSNELTVEGMCVSTCVLPCVRVRGWGKTCEYIFVWEMRVG